MRTRHRVGAAVLSGWFAGCVAEIDQTTYLQDATVTSPVQQPPVHLVTAESRNAVTITPYVSTTTNASLSGYVPSHTKVNSEGVFQVDTLTDSYGGVYLQETPGANVYAFHGKNLSWSAEVPTVGIDVDLAYTSVAVGAGFRYGTSDNASLYGATLGVGFFSVGTALGFRVEGGVVWQTSHYRATSVVVTTQRIFPFSEESTSMGIYEDEETKTRLSWYASIMLNTTFDFPVGAFLQASISEQTLFSYTPRQHISMPFPFFIFPHVDEETEVTAAVTAFLLSPGLYVRLGEQVRLAGGVRFPYIGSEEITSGGQPVIPFVQVDLILPTGK